MPTATAASALRKHATVFLCYPRRAARGPPARTRAAVRSSLGGTVRPPSLARTLPSVIDRLAAGAEPGLVATAGPRHFGFVIGGALPSAPPPLAGVSWTKTGRPSTPFSHRQRAAIEGHHPRPGPSVCFGLPDTASVGPSSPAAKAPTQRSGRGARYASLAGWAWECGARRLMCRLRSASVWRAGSRQIYNLAAAAWPWGSETAIPIPADDRVRMDPGLASKALAARDGPTHRLCACGNVATWRVRRLRADRRRVRGPSRRFHVDGGVRVLWSRPPHRPPAPHRRGRG